MKQMLLNNWHPMRWVALILGLVLGGNWLMNAAPISGLLSLFFLFQAVTNSGCLVGSCAPRYQEFSDTGNNVKDVHFEEIKSDR